MFLKEKVFLYQLGLLSLNSSRPRLHRVGSRHLSHLSFLPYWNTSCCAECSIETLQTVSGTYCRLCAFKKYALSVNTMRYSSSLGNKVQLTASSTRKTPTISLLYCYFIIMLLVLLLSCVSYNLIGERGHKNRFTIH